MSTVNAVEELRGMIGLAKPQVSLGWQTFVVSYSDF